MAVQIASFTTDTGIPLTNVYARINAVNVDYIKKEARIDVAYYTSQVASASLPRAIVTQDTLMISTHQFAHLPNAAAIVQAFFDAIDGPSAVPLKVAAYAYIKRLVAYQGAIDV